MKRSPNLGATIEFLFVGEVQNRWPGKAPSAILKTSTDKTLFLAENGFENDNQADLKVHGGPEKAVHHYNANHMEYWSNLYPNQAASFKPGFFGENISTSGLDENNLHIGDVFELGTSIVQICQGRQPCWKLNEHTQIPSLASQFQRSGFTGWYYRVLKNGYVKAGDRISLIERPLPDFPLALVIAARFEPDLDLSLADELAHCPHLSLSWQSAFRKKSNRYFIENTEARLKG